MKKTRTEKPVVPISLSSKRGSLNQDQLFTPYKIDWKGTPLQSVDNNTSKNFFQTMKSELSNIKNDFEKLIKKESTSKSDREDSLKQNQGYVKSKCQSVFKKIEKANFMQGKPNQQVQKRQQCPKNDLFINQMNDDNASILALQRKLPCSMTYDIRNGAIGTSAKNTALRGAQVRQRTAPVEQNQESLKQSKAKYIQSTSDELFPLSKDEEHTTIRSSKAQLADKRQKMNYMQQISRMKAQVQAISSEAVQRRRQHQKLSQQKKVLGHKLQAVEIQNRQKQSSLRTLQAHGIVLEKQVARMEAQISQLNAELSSSLQKQIQDSSFHTNFAEERNFLLSKLDQISFHHQNLANINLQISGENEMLNEKLFSVQRYAEQMKQRYQQTEGDYKRKIEYIQKQIQEYQKREDMFSRQIDQLTLRLNESKAIKKLPAVQEELKANHLQHNSAKSSDRVLQKAELIDKSAELRQQNQQLRLEIQLLRKEVAVERRIHQQLREKMSQELKSRDFTQLGQQFEAKINESVEQIYKLRNKISHMEADIFTLELKNKSLAEQIQLYEQREQSLANGRSISTNEWEGLMEENDKLKQENKSIMQRYEFEVMKRQNESSSNGSPAELAESQRQKMNQIIKNQIDTVARLLKEKESLKQLANICQNQVEKLQLTVQKTKGQLSIQILKNKSSQVNGGQSIAKIAQRHQFLYKSLEVKTRQLRNVHNFIHKVLVEKLHRREQEQQMDFYLRELNQVMNIGSQSKED